MKIQIFLYNINTGLDNFEPPSKCKESEHKCKNSYRKNICVSKYQKDEACTDYPKIVCDDYDGIHYSVNQNNQRVVK